MRSKKISYNESLDAVAGFCRQIQHLSSLFCDGSDDLCSDILTVQELERRKSYTWVYFGNCFYKVIFLIIIKLIQQSNVISLS